MCRCALFCGTQKASSNRNITQSNHPIQSPAPIIKPNSSIVSRSNISNALDSSALHEHRALSDFSDQCGSPIMHQRQTAVKRPSYPNGLNTNLFKSNHKPSAMSYLVILLINLCLVAGATSSKCNYSLVYFDYSSPFDFKVLRFFLSFLIIVSH